MITNWRSSESLELRRAYYRDYCKKRRREDKVFAARKRALDRKYYYEDLTATRQRRFKRYHSNINHYREYQRLRRLSHGDQIRIWAKAYYARSREKFVSWGKARRTLGKVTKVVYDCVLLDNRVKYGELTCELCLKPIGVDKLNVDHKISVCKGGTNNRDNLQVSHAVCNIRKGAGNEYFRSI